MRHPFGSRLSIRSQVLAALLVAVTVVAAALLLFFAQRQRTQASQALEARVEGTADMLAVGVALGLRSPDLTGLARAMSYARRDPAIRWVVVVDTSGAPIATYAPQGATAPTSVGDDPLGRIVQHGDVLTIAQPVLDGTESLGVLHLGVSMTAAEAAIRQDQRTALAVVLGITLLATLFGVVVSRRISRPIEELRDVAVRLMEGDAITIPRSGSAETAALGRAFRSMAERIRETLGALTTQADELATSRDAALGATKTKSLFLATMSHELRTPMTGVLGMLDLLSRTSLSSKQHTFTRTARESAESLLVLIDDILDFSKIEAGKLTLEEVAFDPCTVAEDVASLLAERAHRKGLALVCDVGVDVPDIVIGDPTRIRQILLNLGGNAVKFTSTGEVRIAVSVQHRHPERTVVRFAVHDTGPGIADTAMPQLFAAFAQADASTTRHFGGTGLGLSICQGLVELMGGSIDVVSALGRGAEFRVDVPFMMPAASTSAFPRQPKPRPLAGMQVLLVHRPDAQCAVITAYLEQSGANVVVRARVEHDAAAAPSSEPDVVILNLSQSTAPAVEQLETLRAAARVGAARVILLATLDSPVLLENERAGVGTLALPVRRQALVDAVLAANTGEADVALEIFPTVAASMARVLVAEDNPVNRQIAQFMLRELGHDVLLAEDGQQTLDVLAREHVDLVLMDCQMPVLDGFETTRELRRREGGATRMPVVALTANAVKGDREACLAAGMDDYLAKPYKRAQLAAVCARWIGARPTDPVAPLTSSAEAHTFGEFVRRLQVHLGEDNEAFARNLLGQYLAVSTQIVTGMRRAAAAGDAMTIRRSAHQLRGSSASVCVNHIADSARLLESLPSSAPTSAVIALVDEIERSLAALREVAVAD